MHRIITTCIICSFLVSFVQGQDENIKLSQSLISVTGSANPISASIINRSFVAENGERFLRFEMELNKPINEVWEAIATEEGVKTWMAPAAKLDLKIGGKVQTNYDKNAKIGDKGTITLGIINYVPNEMLIYKITLNDIFPKKCKKEDENLQEIIQVKALSENKTLVSSTMLGWGEGKDWDKAYSFFEAGNRWSYQQLVKRFKTGPIKWQ